MIIHLIHSACLAASAQAGLRAERGIPRGYPGVHRSMHRWAAPEYVPKGRGRAVRRILPRCVGTAIAGAGGGVRRLVRLGLGHDPRRRTSGSCPRPWRLHSYGEVAALLPQHWNSRSSICSSRPFSNHNSAVGGAARRPPGRLQLPIPLKTDWAIE